MPRPKQTRIRLGMIGGGQGAFIGQVHRLAARLDDACELVCGAFSRSADNNKLTGEQCYLPSERVYADWQQLLASEQRLPAEKRMQLLVIATPNHLHVPIAEAAMQAGFHVFCEKPAGVSLRDVQHLAEIWQASGCLYGLAHTYLGYPMVWQAREMVSEGQLGKIRKIHVEYPQGWLGERLEQQGNKQAAWRTDPALAGISGCMADIGTHAFGLVEFISGHRVNELCASLANHADGRQLDDDGDVLLRTAQGASGTLMASQVCSGEENALKIRIYGDKGALEWHQMEPNSLLYRPLQAPMRTLRAGIDQFDLFPSAMQRMRLPGGHPEGYLEALGNLYRDIAQAIHQGKQGDIEGVPGMASGLRGMAFIEAVTTSAVSEQKWTPLSATQLPATQLLGA